MTKDRARKQAARERARQTGERYVVALRATDAAPEFSGPPLLRTMHDFTHRVPGVPEHSQARRNRPRGHTGRPNPTRVHPRRQPRVLVAWQKWIADRVTR